MVHQMNMAVSALLILAALGLAHAQYGHTFGGGYGGGYGGTTGGGYTQCFQVGGGGGDSGSASSITFGDFIVEDFSISISIDDNFLFFGGGGSSSSSSEGGSGRMMCIPMNTGRRSNTNVVPPHKHEPDHVHHIVPPKPAPAPAPAYHPPSIYRNHYAPQHGPGYGVPQHTGYAPQPHTGYAPQPHTGYAPQPHNGFAPQPHTGYAQQPHTGYNPRPRPPPRHHKPANY